MRHDDPDDREREMPPLFLQAWFVLLSAHADLVPRVDKELRSACGIPLTWFDVLQQLHLAPDQRLRMQELADALLEQKRAHPVDRSDRSGRVGRPDRRAGRPQKLVCDPDAGRAEPRRQGPPGRARECGKSLRPQAERKGAYRIAGRPGPCEALASCGTVPTGTTRLAKKRTLSYGPGNGKSKGNSNGRSPMTPIGRDSALATSQFPSTRTRDQMLWPSDWTWPSDRAFPRLDTRCTPRWPYRRRR